MTADDDDEDERLASARDSRKKNWIDGLQLIASDFRSPQLPQRWIDSSIVTFSCSRVYVITRRLVYVDEKRLLTPSSLSMLSLSSLLLARTLA